MGGACCMHEKGKAYRVLMGKLERKYCLGFVGVDGRMLKWILKK